MPRLKDGQDYLLIHRGHTHAPSTETSGMGYLQSLTRVAGGRALPQTGHLKPYDQVAALLFLNTAIFVYALSAANFALGDELRCSDRPVVVNSAGRNDAETACDAASDAIGFFESLGVATTEAIEIHLVSRLPGTANELGLGCYVRAERRVYVLAYSEFLKQDNFFFERPFDRTNYKSFITHEVAHAVAAVHFSIPSPSIRAQEYLAYVTMLATMPKAQRELLLSRYSGQGFDSADQISTTYYMLGPHKFGVEAYRHFRKPANGSAFIKEVLSGRVLAGED